jgi:hypothetical protein
MLLSKHNKKRQLKLIFEQNSVTPTAEDAERNTKTISIA